MYPYIQICIYIYIIIIITNLFKEKREKITEVTNSHISITLYRV